MDAESVLQEIKDQPITLPRKQTEPPQIRFLSHGECFDAARKMAKVLSPGLMFGIPRGGIPVMYLLKAVAPHLSIADRPDTCDVFIDDIIDSGTTRDRWLEDYPHRPFYALTDFLATRKKKGEWIVFPWESNPWESGEDPSVGSAEDIVIRLLQFIGEDPKRGGLQETPARFLKAWKEWTSGYSQDPKDILKTFNDGAENYDEMVWLRNCPFYSQCEHHLAPFFGTVTIAYIPDRKIVGISKLGRVTEVFARRLQVQERLTVQIADAIQEVLEPKGVGVLIKAKHLCMESRGYNRQGQEMITSALRGKFLEDAKVRAEFLSVAK